MSHNLRPLQYDWEDEAEDGIRKHARPTFLDHFRLIKTLGRPEEELEKFPCPVLSYLRPVELTTLAWTSKKMHETLTAEGPLWGAILRIEPGERGRLARHIAAELGLKDGVGEVKKNPRWRVSIIWRAYREAHEVHEFQKIIWSEPSILSEFELLKQESHSAAVLLNGDVVATICGWSDLNIVCNDVMIFNTRKLPSNLVHQWAQSVGEMPLEPLYGHAAAAVDDNTIALFGGLRLSGYRWEVNSLFLVKITEVEEEEEEEEEETHNKRGEERERVEPRRKGRGRWSGYTAQWSCLESSPESAVIPTGRGYCSLTACWIFPHSQKHSHRGQERDWAGWEKRRADILIAFGGIVAEKATDVLEVLDVDLQKWYSPTVVGPSPCSRFGHSGTFLKESQSLLIAGGSNESDPMSNLEDLADVWLLTGLATLSGLLRGNMIETGLAWSKAATTGQLPPRALGRCHTASRIGDNLVFFGGHPKVQNHVVALDLKSFRWKTPKEKGGVVPISRHAHVTVALGRRLLVYGGWQGTTTSSVQLLHVGSDFCGHSRNASDSSVSVQFVEDETDQEDDIPEYGWGMSSKDLAFGAYGTGVSKQGLFELPDGLTLE